MVSLNNNNKITITKSLSEKEEEEEAICFDTCSLMALPNVGGSFPATTSTTTSSCDDASKKVRKPYTITKSRESWTEPEHDKFLEALQLFDRDWKKIEAFVGSKTVIQIRSHAQKYFLKVQKSGTNEHLPPPRPKRKAAHPYPQKAPKISQVVSQPIPSSQAFPAVPEPGYVRRPGSSALLLQPDTAISTPGWTENSMSTSGFSHANRGDAKSAGQSMPKIYPSNSNESVPRTRAAVLPDFAQVYGFIGSVFDPDVTGHLQNLKKMDPIDIETVLLLMRNLSVNLASPSFEDHRKLLSTYEIETQGKAYDTTDSMIITQSDSAAV